MAKPLARLVNYIKTLHAGEEIDKDEVYKMTKDRISDIRHLIMPIWLETKNTNVVNNIILESEDDISNNDLKRIVIETFGKKFKAEIINHKLFRVLLVKANGDTDVELVEKKKRTYIEMVRRSCEINLMNALIGIIWKWKVYYKFGDVSIDTHLSIEYPLQMIEEITNSLIGGLFDYTIGELSGKILLRIDFSNGKMELIKECKSVIKSASKSERFIIPDSKVKSVRAKYNALKNDNFINEFTLAPEYSMTKYHLTKDKFLAVSFCLFYCLNTKIEE